MSAAIARALFVFLSAAVCGTSPQAQTALTFPIERPEFRVGDLWVYRRLDGWTNREVSRTTVEAVGEESGRLVYRFETTPGTGPTTRYYTPDLQPCRSMQGSGKQECAGSLRFPISADYRHTYSRRLWINGLGYDAASCVAGSTEAIAGPAGKYDAVRIDCKGNWTRVFEGSGSGRYEESLWYSPAAKRVVRSTFTNYNTSGQPFDKWIDELVEYRPAP